MRFVYIIHEKDQLPNMHFLFNKTDEWIYPRNEGPVKDNAYFVYGKVQFLYLKQTGELLSVTGWIPEFQTLPRNNIEKPASKCFARVFVGDNTQDPFFDIAEECNMELDASSTLLHLGSNESDAYVSVSECLQIGFRGDDIKDIYITLKIVDEIPTK